jgi:hypothetical protein
VILLPLGNSLNISNVNAIADFDNKGERKNVSSLNCNNFNLNVNGLELDVFPPFLADSGLAAEAADSNTDPSSIAGNDDRSEINDFRFICINNNNNTVVGGEEPIPLTPPEPTASLTVKKQVFGCQTPLDSTTMNCEDLQNNSSAPWLNCNGDDPDISGTIFCQSLPESLFDIEVLDDQNTQIQQLEGSENGTTIQNLEPSTYTVNEIEIPTFVAGQLVEDPDVEASCKSAGFPDGGILNYVPPGIDFILNYDICFKYEDEEGNDCSEITLAAGEERTCIVKNYIRFSFLE